MVEIYDRLAKGKEESLISKEKKFRTQRRGKKKEIIVSHVTIRQSISILLLKLIVLEIMAAVFFIIFQMVLFSPQFSSIFSYIHVYGIGFFLFAVTVKIILTIYIVLLWLNEYYEITPASVRHRSGIIFVKKEKLALDDIQSVTLSQGLFGRLLNFGTLSLYDWKWRKYEHLYAIHNPMKYIEIVESLLPGIDEERSIIREHVLEKE